MSDKENFRILLVDDSITVRELMKRQLSDLGIKHLFEAKNGIEALTAYKTHKPNLVFLDINMPEMNGVETLSKILEIDKQANVIILSSLGTKEKINETLNIGAKNFLIKPIENENIERIISEMIK